MITLIRDLFNTRTFGERIQNMFSDRKQLNLFLLITIGIRLLFFISDGHNSDFDFFEHWADRINQSGFTNIYSIRVDRFECDYPPLYLYVIALFGKLFLVLGWDIHTQVFDTFLKAFTLVIELSFLRYFYQRTQNKVFIWMMLISPVTILNAYGWGQIDIIYSILLFVTTYAILQRKLIMAACALGLSLALKTQTLLFMPLIGLLFLLSGNSIKDKLIALGLLVLVFLIPNLPFILYAPDAMDSINPHITAAGRYNFIAVNAFNIYWALWADFSLKLKLQFPPNDVLVFGLISRKLLAYGIFSLIYAYTLIQLYLHHKNIRSVFSILSFFCFSYFMFLPEMHERYLFPFFIFSAFLCSLDAREFRWFIIIAALHCANLLWGWGEQKFIKQQWIFEATRLIALASFVVWLAYARVTTRRLQAKTE